MRLILFSAFAASALPGMDCRPVNAQDRPESAGKIAEMAWVSQGETTNTLLYSSLQKDAWSRPVQLSRANQFNLVPTLSTDNEGRTFVVWTVITETGSSLACAILRNNEIETGPAAIDTGMANNMGTFLTVDNDGIPWLVWSGNNGTTSDVFYSYWQNGGWQAPQRVHAENDVPDILPELAVDPDGAVFVIWNTYQAGESVRVRKKLKDSAVQHSSGSPDSAMMARQKDVDPFSCITHLPADDIVPDSAALLNHCPENTGQFRFLGKARQNWRELKK